MIFEKGDMWQIFNRTDLFCITTNSVIKKNGHLVMGKGSAFQAFLKLPGVDFYLGQKIKHFSTYGLVVIDNFRPQLIGAFQTKVDWKDKSNVELIKYSVQRLREYFLAFKPSRIDLPFPGIGYGGLSKDDVFPVLASLPDNVHVWEF